MICILSLEVFHQPALANHVVYDLGNTNSRHFEQAKSATEQSSTKRIITTIKLEDIEDVLRRANVLYRRESDSTLRFDVGTYKIFITLQCKDTSRGCSSAIMLADFRLSNRPSLNLVNEWNRTKSNSRAYLDSDGSVTLESDILAEGGITDDNLVYRVGVFLLSVDSFAKYIGFN